MAARTRTMSDAEVRALVRDAVHETLTSLGVDPDNPVEMQRDFQHLRQWRETTETVKRQSIITIVVIMVSGTIGLIWLAIKGS